MKIEDDANWSWDNLRYFLAVAQYGTISDAARHIRVSHSTVQRRITAFEQELQSSLFSRTSQGYSMTEAGQALFKEAVQMQSTVTSISQKITGADAEVSGKVVISSTDTFCFKVLPRMIKSLVKRYPDLNISLNMIDSVSNPHNLEADIAIRPCITPPANLIGRKTGDISFVACASAEYCEQHGIDQFPDDANMSEHNFIVLDYSFACSPMYKWLDRRLPIKPKTTTASGILNAHALCKAGLGITLLPSYLTSSALDVNNELRQLPTNGALDVSFELWILSHADLRYTERVKVVRQHLYEELTRFFVG